MKIHFISIGGSVMHNLAIALKNMGFEITGSDDEIFEPSRGRLLDAGLLPNEMGWQEKRINKDLDGIILGMHAKIDNPELKKAQELSIPIYSYPEYIYKVAEGKKRVVIAGSHGKTSTTGMIMHVLRELNFEYDYLIGASLKGFDQMVQISDAPLMILEGDEYLSSPIDRRPKIMHYRPDIAVITGIAWDHINVFPSFDIYKDQFLKFMMTINEGGSLIYYQNDSDLVQIVERADVAIEKIAYAALERDSDNDIVRESGRYPTHVFGHHNDQNLNAALLVCSQLGIAEEDFFEAVASFEGAAKRLQKLSEKGPVYLDFAHAPSKVEATVKAMREQFPERKLRVFLELHTFSSLNEKFIPFYRNSLKGTDEATVFCNSHTFKAKNMKPLEKDFLIEAFNHQNLQVIYEAVQLESILREVEKMEDATILIMSSGNLGSIDLKSIFY